MPDTTGAAQYFAFLLQLGLIMFEDEPFGAWRTLRHVRERWVFHTGSPMDLTAFGFTEGAAFFLELRRARLIRLTRRLGNVVLRPRRAYWHGLARMADQLFHRNEMSIVRRSRRAEF